MNISPRLWIGTLLLAPLATADPAATIDQFISQYQKLKLFNGSALVAEQSQVVLKKGYGLANIEWNIPNAPDTKFRLGSITKQFTATLILQLVEQGKIDLNAPVTRYLPDYPARTGDRVTIHHLLNHTSGIPGYTETPRFGEKVRDPLPLRNSSRPSPGWICFSRRARDSAIATPGIFFWVRFLRRSLGSLIKISCASVYLTRWE
jgi:CubicO group peptidase (beta-lactamase class C family)